MAVCSFLSGNPPSVVGSEEDPYCADGEFDLGSEVDWGCAGGPVRGPRRDSENGRVRRATELHLDFLG